MVRRPNLVADARYEEDDMTLDGVVVCGKKREKLYNEGWSTTVLLVCVFVSFSFVPLSSRNAQTCVVDIF